MLNRKMNLSEITEHLPNGLHDAEVEEFTYNLDDRTVAFKLNVWIGAMDQPPADRERYRRGVLRFEGVLFFTKTESAYFSDNALTLLDWSLAENTEEKAKLPAGFTSKFFELAACYCQFRIGCQNVSFEWTEAGETNSLPAGHHKD